MDLEMLLARGLKLEMAISILGWELGERIWLVNFCGNPGGDGRTETLERC